LLLYIPYCTISLVWVRPLHFKDKICQQNTFHVCVVEIINCIGTFTVNDVFYTALQTYSHVIYNTSVMDENCRDCLKRLSDSDRQNAIYFKPFYTLLCIMVNAVSFENWPYFNIRIYIWKKQANKKTKRSILRVYLKQRLHIAFFK
jgi:hypothetical protein